MNKQILSPTACIVRGILFIGFLAGLGGIAVIHNNPSPYIVFGGHCAEGVLAGLVIYLADICPTSFCECLAQGIHSILAGLGTAATISMMYMLSHVKDYIYNPLEMIGLASGVPIGCIAATIYLTILRRKSHG